MKILKKENWWIWLILAFLSGGSSTLVLGALLDVYDEDAWYWKWTKKLSKPLLGFIIGTIVIVFLVATVMFTFLTTSNIESLNNGLALIVLLISIIYLMIAFAIVIFQIQTLTQLNAKLQTPGSELYLSPYIWILCIIVPILGWIMLMVMYCYLEIWYLVMLYRGKGEIFLKGQN